MSDASRKTRFGPVTIEIDEDVASALPGPDRAPPVPDESDRPEGRAMTTAAVLAARKPSRLARWFWGLAGAILATVLAAAAWEFVTGLLAAYPMLGWAVAGLFGLFAFVVLAIAVKEIAAISRLGRLDALHRDAQAARDGGGLEAAQDVVARLETLYAGREDTSWGRSRLAERKGDVFDGEALLDLASRELLAPLDAAARREVEAAARQVAGVTALVPLSFADVAAALVSNLRMIRRVAEIYGGRSGTIGSWRLMRAVFTHLLATGAVAAGEDMIEPLLGGNVLAKLSRRFGEGMVNGALTARVGVAAMEVCRPLPFTPKERPSVRGLVGRSLTGLFDRKRDG
ncbi:YcjF family protein [Litorisediminicola beolgyonensis]|uniref:YcjF family protein n=1 Tax=Litorisediminicola beolgyonensis TaxID=1173614 RepID=A0ABW3ZFP7_9RHOB